MLPSGTYHLGLPTTMTDRRHNATALFRELLDELEGQASVAEDEQWREAREAKRESLV